MKNVFLEYLYHKVKYICVFVDLSLDSVKESLEARYARLVRWVKLGHDLIKSPNRECRQKIIARERSYWRRMRRIERYNDLSYDGLIDLMYAIVNWYEYPDSRHITKEDHDNAKANFERAKSRLLLYSRWHDMLILDTEDCIMQEEQANRLENTQLEDFGSTEEWIDFLTEIFDNAIIDFKP